MYICMYIYIYVGSVNGSSDDEEGDPLELPSLDFLNSDDEKVDSFSVFFLSLLFLFPLPGRRRRRRREEEEEEALAFLLALELPISLFY